MRFKELLVFIIIYISVLSLSAQDESDRYHLYGFEKRWQIQGYLGPLIAFSTVEKTFAMDIGGTAGFLVNKKLFIGIYGQRLMTLPSHPDLTNIGYMTTHDGKVKMLQGGGILGYIHKPEKLIRWGVSSSFGVGNLILYAKDQATLNLDKTYKDRVFIITPKLFAQKNLTRKCLVNVSAGYRFFGKMNGLYTNPAGELVPIFNKSDYDRPEFLVSLLFGNFDKIREIPGIEY